MTDKIALVTGASRGLGYFTGIELAKAGYHVIALARTTGGLEELADAIEAVGGSTTLVPLDITDDDGLARMGRAIYDRWGKLDLLVHCAAHAAPLSPVPHAAPKDFDRSFAVNARGTQRLIVMLDPLLKVAGGLAVHIDDSTRAGQKFFAAYGASKAAARAIVDSWAAESIQTGPRVEIFTPEPMPTALRARFFPGEDRDRLTPCRVEAARLAGTLAPVS